MAAMQGPLSQLNVRAGSLHRSTGVPERPPLSNYGSAFACKLMSQPLCFVCTSYVPTIFFWLSPRARSARRHSVLATFTFDNLQPGLLLRSAQRAERDASTGTPHFCFSKMTTRLVLDTDLGTITLRLLPESAPQTVAHIINIVNSKLYDGVSFYRSDFVIQFGLHGSGRTNPHGNLQINETGCTGKDISNTRGTAAVAHFDVPDCGGTELFINLTNNAHLDSAYGGYCVWAKVEDDDEASFRVVDAIADAVKSRGKVGIRTATIR